MNGCVGEAVAEAHRREWAYVLAATVRVTRDLDLAEECAQDAFAQALATWPTGGIPANTGAWLTTVARRRALDALRREGIWRRTVPLLVERVDGEDPHTQLERRDAIGDDRLRLICTCCHPALAQPSQVALTLRLLCGLSTAEVARAFLVSETTMAARITRAKKKISAARIPYRVPDIHELPARIDAVLDVLHLVFTNGHTAATGSELTRTDLLSYALDLARMLRELLPADTEVTGLLALFVFTDARRATRLNGAGELVLLAEQDRQQWDGPAIAYGDRLLRQALAAKNRPGRFLLQAAIAGVHAQAKSSADTDWEQIIGLYDLLGKGWPSPVVELNRAAAIGLSRGPQAGLDALAPLCDQPQLASYPYLASARASFLGRLGRPDEAIAAYCEAIMLTDNDVERAFLTQQLKALQ